ncbi:MAG: hypothetical protein K0U86_09545 [Planctomycetes bacterium]|nr:hypothetical protein [Planctomycetota bacterium]MCH9725134.1 hypothetical protein [Planctomycetota bacterium]MCH9774904.1 hypothetical protein [Planctomycetota bacterium]MCH9791854.1 hypothetical protein [Planctomycetota bacterium]
MKHQGNPRCPTAVNVTQNANTMITQVLMQGLHAYEPKTRTGIDRESLIPQDHLLWQINGIVIAASSAN